MRLRARRISRAPEPFTTLHGTWTLCVLTDHRQEQHIALALMIPLVMNMRYVWRQHMAERRYPAQDKPQQTLLLA
jgi:hypothetical protein